MEQQFQLYCDSCEKILPTLADASIDLIIEDGPYHKVKDEDWDNRHKTVDGFIAWKRTILEQYQRILKPNGSLYVFASPQMAWHVEGVVRERFNVLNSIIWHKPGQSYAEVYGVENFRALVYMSERIIFAEQGNAETYAIGNIGEHYFQPIQRFLNNQRNGASIQQLVQTSGLPESQISHYFRQDANGWRLPDQDALSRMGFNLKESVLVEWREQLRQEYEEMRRPFNATPDAPYTDVWTFPTVMNYPGKHPCEKPLELMEHIIRLSSKPGAVVLDCFMGKGTTGHACATVGERRFIGIEQSSQWFAAAERRIKDAHRIKQRLPKQLAGTESDYADAPLFAGL